MANKRVPQHPEVTPLTVRVADAARMLGIGKTKIYELIAEHEIEALKLGSATLIVFGSLEAFIERQRTSVSLAATSPKRPGRPRASFAKIAAVRRT
jgi:excisionase family DNA binding protein